MSIKTQSLIEEYDIQWVDLRFTDTQGKEQHVTLPSNEIDADFFEAGENVRWIIHCRVEKYS